MTAALNQDNPHAYSINNSNKGHNPRVCHVDRDFFLVMIEGMDFLTSAQLVKG